MKTRRSAPELVIPPEVASFLEGGLIMHAATRGPDRVPEAVLTPAIRIEDEGASMTVFVPQVLAERTLANLRDNGEIALTATRVTDNRSVQVKGRVLESRRARNADRRHIERLLDLSSRELSLVGMPRSITARLVWWPAIALRVQPREIFEQTPGPRAGQPLGPGVSP